MLFALVAILFATLIQPCYALDQIVRPYQSVRSAGMGGVRLSTGLYDENFFNNPARVTANPISRFTVFQMAPTEVTAASVSQLSKMLSGTPPLNAILSSQGNNIHQRTQMIFPAYYHATTETRKWALAVGIITSVQMDAMLRQSYQISMSGFADIGPAVSFGMKFLKDDALSVGVTGHFMYRAGITPNYSLLNYIQGTAFNINSMTGDGAMANADLGATYHITKLGEFDIHSAAAIQNLIGGQFNITAISAFRNGVPPVQNRSYGIGVSATRAEWYKFTNTTFALEITDVLNNMGGGFFRMLHMGGETHWHKLAIRLGINQGYFCAGLGIDLRAFTANISTYGEEMTLNAGGLEDRRYTFDLGFHI